METKQPLEPATDWTAAPLRPVALAPRDLSVERRADGSVLLRSRHSLPTPASRLGDLLIAAAARAPERPFLCQRRAGEGPRLGAWRSVSFKEALLAARAVAQALIDRGLGPEDAIVVLSGNSIEHGLLMLGAFLAGVPIAPLSPGYSLSANLTKLRQVCELLRPALVFAEDLRPVTKARDEICRWLDRRPEFVALRSTDGPEPATPFGQLLKALPGAEVDRRHARVGPDSVAKFLFTSGSTGLPKAVPNTHRMLCANQAMMAATVPPDPAAPPVFVDWLPWSHTFGGNVTFNWILRDAGTLFIDGGRPLPREFEETLANLREVSPTHFFNVPAGYSMLVDAMDADPALRQSFFRDLQLCYYGGSGLPQATFDRLESLSVATTGQRFAFTTGCGSTETGPIATYLHWCAERAGIIGLPIPGVDLKLVPSGARYELRLKGPNVFTGYHQRPDLSATAFDEEGYFLIGDAVRPADPEDFNAGLVHDGRVVEDFKLATGTFVAVGALRLAVLSKVPLLKDAVVAGPDRPWLGLLAWLDEGRCQAVLGDAHASLAELSRHPRIRQMVGEQIDAYNRSVSGSSQQIGSLCLLDMPALPEAGEITEKGYLNQKAVLSTRAESVARLYADPELRLQRDAPTMRSANSP